MIRKNVIGLMSGSSLDGLDIVDADFLFDGKWHFDIIKAENIPYDSVWTKKLSDAFTQNIESIKKLDIEYGDFIGECTSDFIKRNQLHPDLIASHGHTVFHRPDEKYTLQIGCGRNIADKCGVKVINNFRAEDVSKGGQGAPLVPVGDKLLFSDYQFCLNIGGISNISFDLNDKRIAYDICIANQLLNYIAQKKGLEYDKDGVIASNGIVNEELLHFLKNNEYYLKPAPKSLGREFFETFQRKTIDESRLRIEDLEATAVEYIASEIAESVNGLPSGKMLVTGGGALNKFLINRIDGLCKHKIVIPQKDIIDYKEALIFAFLGLLKDLGQTNVFCSVTGAKSDSSSGDVWKIKC